MSAFGTYARGAGPTHAAPRYAAAVTKPGNRLSLPMPCAICVELRLGYATNPPANPPRTFATPTALSSSLASPSRSVVTSTAEVMRRRPSVDRPNTVSA